VYWVLTAHGIRFVLQFGISVWFARLLEPRDSGTIGIATMFFGISRVVGNFGMASALIQRRTLMYEYAMF
jgi:O-antigen/teichoic acid export membrane protein